MTVDFGGERLSLSIRDLVPLDRSTEVYSLPGGRHAELQAKLLPLKCRFT